MMAMNVLAAVTPADISDALLGGDISGWDVALAVLAVVAGWMSGRFAQRAVRGVLGRVEGISEDLRQLLARLAKYLVVLVGVGVALGFLGAAVQPLLTVAIIVAVIGALALRGIADNFASGVVIQTRRPVQLGDEIEALGHSGTVIEMNGRAVVLKTNDGHSVHLPNSKVLDNPLVNHSARHPRCTDVEVRAARAGDNDTTLEVIRAAVAGAEGVADAPAVTVRLTGADPERIFVHVQFWGDPVQQPTVVSRVIGRVADGLRERGIDAAVVSPPHPAPLTPPATI
jgi:small-conductance mechanosensitive channel